MACNVGWVGNSTFCRSNLHLTSVKRRYPISWATWEPEASIDDQQLIEEFYEAALKEGIEDNDPHSTILLKEAVEGGWKDPNA